MPALAQPPQQTPAQQAAEHQQTLAAAAPALAPAAGPALATVVGIGSTAEAAATITRAFAALLQRRRESNVAVLLPLLQQRFPDESQYAVAQIVRAEQEREVEFQRKAVARVAEEAARALTLPEPAQRKEALDGLSKRELNYARLREEAMVTRAIGATAVRQLKQLSPEGAYWKLGANVKQHTPGCIAMADRFWPWEVIDLFSPPLHFGCACELYGKQEAIDRGFMRADQVPDRRDAIRRARRLALAIPELNQHLHEADYIDYLDQLLILEAARATAAEPIPDMHRALRAYVDEFKRVRYPEGTRHGGQFAPKRGGGDPGGPSRKALERAIPRLPESPASISRKQRGTHISINGYYEFIPEADRWQLRSGGHDYHSPAGSLNVYRDGDTMVYERQGRRGKALAPEVGRAPRALAIPSRADIGVTPYRGRSGDMSAYRKSSRYKSYLTNMDRIAGEESVRIHDRRAVDGLWEGSHEPADSVRVSGAPEAVRRFAQRVGKRYNQDGVMIFTPDESAPGFLYRVPVADRQRALDLLHKHGFSGGRFTGDAVEMADPDGSQVDAARALALEAGQTLGYTQGRVEFPGKPYPAGLRESLGAGEAHPGSGPEGFQEAARPQGPVPRGPDGRGEAELVEAFDPAQHPRDWRGRWARKVGESAADHLKRLEQEFESHEQRVGAAYFRGSRGVGSMERKSRELRQRIARVRAELGGPTHHELRAEAPGRAKPKAPAAPKIKYSPDVLKINTAADAEAYFRDKLGVEGKFVSAPFQDPTGQLEGDVRRPYETNADFLRQLAQATTDAMERFSVLKGGKHGKLGGVSTTSAMPPDPRAWADVDLTGTWAMTGPDPRTTDMVWEDAPGNVRTGDTFIQINADHPDLASDHLAAAADGSLSPADLTPYGRLMHELGHAVDMTSGFEFSYGDDRGTPEALALEAGGVSPGDAARVSLYGASSPGEAWAEMFATLNTPGALEKVPPEVRRKLERLRAYLATKPGPGMKLMLVTRGPAFEAALAQGRRNAEFATWQEAMEAPALAEAFDERRHPRGRGGRWIRARTAAPTAAEYVDKLREMIAGQTGGDAGMYDLLRREGRAYTPQPLPADLERFRGVPRECFKNAFLAAFTNPDLTYVEGFALPAGGLPLPIHHAWVVDKDGKVGELTWPEPGTEYLGVPFATKPLVDAGMSRGVYGMLDNRATYEDFSRFRVKGGS